MEMEGDDEESENDPAPLGKACFGSWILFSGLMLISLLPSLRLAVAGKATPRCMYSYWPAEISGFLLIRHWTPRLESGRC